ncbi:hypothetical protein DFH29DRAFT_1075986 [Suillus ampliporus]|nr:hypothetical protein DFH29DRAFT_1075986 [Suillus ampliporus]
MEGGICKFHNVMFTNQVLSVPSGNVVEGTRVIGATNHHSAAATQLWRMHVIESKGDRFTVTLTHTVSGKYMRAEPQRPGQGVIVSDHNTRWTLIKHNNNGEYKIEAQHGVFVCALNSSNTQVTLANPLGSERNQLWHMERAGHRDPGQ